jgi:hypothetical protein
LKRAGTEQRTGALERTGSLKRTRTLERTGSPKRTRTLERAAADTGSIRIRRATCDGAIARERAALHRRTVTTKRGTAYQRASTVAVSLSILLLFRSGTAGATRTIIITLGALPTTGRTILYAKRPTRQRVRLDLRESSAAVDDGKRGNQTLRSKCNFIHKSHLVPALFERILDDKLANLVWPRPTCTGRFSENLHSKYRNSREIPSHQTPRRPSNCFSAAP